MTSIIILFLILIFLVLVVLMVALYMAWQKISIYLVYNTKYDSASYQEAVTKSKTPKKFLGVNKTEKNGRQIKEVPELVDISDIPFEEGYAAIVEAGEQHGA